MTTLAAPEPVLLQIEPGFHNSNAGEARRGRLRWGAIIVAALAHALVIAAFLLELPFSLSPQVTEPPPIAVSLVMEPPPAPPPPPAKAEPNPRQIAHDLLSGKDQETTAPPQAEAKGEEAAPKLKPPPAPEKPDASEAAAPQPKPRPAPSPPKPKEAMRETAPDPTRHGSVDRAPGETEKTGDPYLNRILAMIEQHRAYPSGTVGSLGLNLEGTVVYLIALSANGAIEGMRLERSSGTSALDETARKMIEQAAPFPPLPNYFPRNGVTLSVTLPIYPTAS
jgi:periplasmic protein TonB